MRCCLKLLTYAVNLFLLLSLSFSLDLKSLAEEKLMEAFGDGAKLQSLQVLSSQLPENYERAELKAEPGSPRGYLYLYQGNKVFTVALNLLWRCKILVAKRDILPGERLNEENTEYVYTYSTRCPKVPEGFVKNFVAKRLIKKGAPVEQRFVKKEFLVKRGQKVKVFYKSDSIEIQFESLSYDNGYYGDTVRVKSPLSGKLIRGRVEDEGVVKIH